AVALQSLARQPPLVDRRLHRAARLLHVSAVVEAAAGGQLVHVGEGLVDALVGVPQLHLAQTRRVHEQRASRQLEELPRRGRVAAGAVLGELLRGLSLVAQQPVGQRRLADAGRPEQRDRPGGSEVDGELVDALAGQIADQVHGDAYRDLLGLEQGDQRVVTEVGLGQHDRGRGAAFPRQRQVALEPPWAEVRVERRNDEDRVHVGREHLRLRGAEVDLAREGRAAREHRVDDRVAQRDPVADRGQVGARRRLVAQPSGEVGAQLSALGEHVVLTAVLSRDAPRYAVVVWLERGREAVVPADLLQVQASSFQEGENSGRCPRLWKLATTECCGGPGASGSTTGGRSRLHVA